MKRGILNYCKKYRKCLFEQMLPYFEEDESSITWLKKLNRLCMEMFVDSFINKSLPDNQDLEEAMAC